MRTHERPFGTFGRVQSARYRLHVLQNEVLWGNRCAHPFWPNVRVSIHARLMNLFQFDKNAHVAGVDLPRCLPWSPVCDVPLSPSQRDSEDAHWHCLLIGSTRMHSKKRRTTLLILPEVSRLHGFSTEGWYAPLLPAPTPPSMPKREARLKHMAKTKGNTLASNNRAFPRPSMPFRVHSRDQEYNLSPAICCCGPGVPWMYNITSSSRFYGPSFHTLFPLPHSFSVPFEIPSFSIVSNLERILRLV